MDKNDIEETPDFLLDDKEFNKSMKKNRRKTIMKNVLITSSVIIVSILIVYTASSKILSKRIHNLDVAESRWIYLTEPNVQQNGSGYTYNIFSADGTHYHTKKVGDRTIPWYTEKSHYTLFNTEVAIGLTIEQYSEEENQWLVFNNQTGQRELQFYHPSIKYNHLPNHLNLLNELDTQSYYEFAFSFDKAYSFEEIKGILDKNDTEWLWVDVHSQEELDTKTEKVEQNTLASFLKGSIFGFPYNSNTGWSNPEHFLNGLKHSEIQNSRYAARASEIFDRLKEGNSEINSDDIKIIGAVVSGSPDELMKYKEAQYIRASSLGVSTKKY